MKILAIFFILVSCQQNSDGQSDKKDSKRFFENQGNSYALTIQHDTENIKDSLKLSLIGAKTETYYTIEFNEYWEYDVYQEALVCDDNRNCNLNEVYSTPDYIEMCNGENEKRNCTYFDAI